MRRALIVLVCLFATGCVTTKRYGGLAVQDAVAVAHGPRLRSAAIATAATGAALLLDDEIARVARHNDDGVLDDVETLGGGNSDKVMAGLFLYGVAARDSRARNAAFDMFVSSIIASKIITPALKATVHRTRPNGGDESFPSNHATQAFALASAVSVSYPRVRWIAYGLATGVGLARIAHDAHWTSDVVAGAAIGTFAGRTVARTNADARAQWSVAVARNGVVVTLRW